MTVAVSAWVFEGVRVAVAGVNAMATAGLSVRVAAADLDVSAALVALTVTVCGLAIEAGAV